MFGAEAAVHVVQSGVFVSCWLCRWRGDRKEGRGRMKRARLQAELHACHSPRFLTHEQALAAGETLPR